MLLTSMMGCGGPSGHPPTSFPFRIAHDGWDIFRAVLDPAGDKLAVWGYGPGSPATPSVGVASLVDGVIRQLGPKDIPIMDMAWGSESKSLVVSVGGAHTQTLQRLDLADGGLHPLSGLTTFQNDIYTGMSVSPDGRSVALSLGDPLATGRPDTEVVVVDLVTGAARVAVPRSSAHPRLPSWLSQTDLLFVEDGREGSHGVTLKQLNLQTSMVTAIDTRGYSVYDISASQGVVAFNGLNPTGGQGVYATPMAPFAPRQVEEGSFSMVYVDGHLRRVVSVATGRGPADAGDVVIDALSS